MRYASSLRSFRPSVYHTKMRESRQVLFPTTQQMNLPACSPHFPFNAERQAGKCGTYISVINLRFHFSEGREVSLVVKSHVCEMMEQNRGGRNKKTVFLGSK